MSAEPKHTPGPWMPGCFVRGEDGCQCKSILFEGYCGAIATVEMDNGRLIGEGGNDSPPREEAVANAHLISAAPDMFAALISAEIASMQLCIGQDPANQCWVVLAEIRAALSKANPGAA